MEQDVFNQFSIGFDYQSQKIDCLKRKGHLQIIDFSNHQGKPPTFDCNDAKKNKVSLKNSTGKTQKEKTYTRQQLSKNPEGETNKSVATSRSSCV